MKNDFTGCKALAVCRDLGEKLQMVKMTLDLARSYGLENEVVWSAMKAHGDGNLNEALGKALQEWDI